jgi:uncharacterized protein YdhG (YjbR/CyaY superfamily)
MSSKAVDDYLAKVDDASKRAALQTLRETIHTLAPEAEETISYGIPTFKLDGPLVSFGAAKNHCAFYGMSRPVLEAMAEDLAGYDTSPGTIRFAADQPLPDALVRKVVLARIAENRASVAARTAKKAAKKKG